MLAVNQLIGLGAGGSDAAATYITYLSAASPYTFTAANIGTPSSDRAVVVVAGSMRGSSGVFTGATLAGSAMTELLNGNVASSTNFTNCAIYIISAPSGSTADIVITATGTANIGIDIYAVTGLLSLAAQGSFTSSANPITGTIACPAGGVIIGGGETRSSSTSRTLSWTGIALDNNSDTASSMNLGVAHSNFSTQQTSLTVTATPSGAIVNEFGCVVSLR